MSEWFRKEAGFHYRVDGNVGLHYMNGDREEYREEDEPALFEDYETLDEALNAARAFVYCKGGWDRNLACSGRPFEITANRSGIGSFEERVAMVTRLGLAGDPNDPEDEGEWEPCDEDGVFDFEDGCGDTAAEYLCGAPGQVREAGTAPCTAIGTIWITSAANTPASSWNSGCKARDGIPSSPSTRTGCPWAPRRRPPSGLTTWKTSWNASRRPPSSHEEAR